MFRPQLQLFVFAWLVLNHV